MGKIDDNPYSTTSIIRRCVHASPSADLIEELTDRGYTVTKRESTDENSQDKRP